MKRIISLVVTLALGVMSLVAFAPRAMAECVYVNDICAWNYTPPDTQPYEQMVSDTRAGGEAVVTGTKEQAEDEGECEGGRRYVKSSQQWEDDEYVYLRMYIHDIVTDRFCDVQEYRFKKSGADPYDILVCQVGRACR